MSPGNVEIVRESIDAYVRRDVDAMRRLTSADVELDWSASKGWLAGVYRGFEDVMRFYRDYFEAFDEIRVEVDSYTPVGESVVVPNIARQRGRDGIEVSARATFVSRSATSGSSESCSFRTPQMHGVPWASRIRPRVARERGAGGPAFRSHHQRTRHLLGRTPFVCCGTAGGTPGSRWPRGDPQTPSGRAMDERGRRNPQAA